MVRSLEITAVLSGIEHAHRAGLFWDPTIELSLDCFICERLGRTTVLKYGAERAVCMSGRNEQHITAARIAAYDVTVQDDRLALRSVVDFWWAPFRDAERGGQATPLSRWARLSYGCRCPHKEESSAGSVQSNLPRPQRLYCRKCGTEIAVDAEAPAIRLLV
ncbi:hypothetical protein [Nonomuraea rhodomycinica]|uniref:Uncharacterized protein n=1 Tax=Nonomuraea rhodomycinica TaxID=1712872 RepID=A0A7Y6IYL7_9ACTN|nr:hypothetical protein [Nonomuraea rhodomycinica]NUW46777.1 hypothetical protein [Nonomuraea rhodomycinica]